MIISIKKNNLNKNNHAIDKYNKYIFKNKTLIGTVEPVIINNKKILARIDTGATRSGMCKSLVNSLKLPPLLKE